VSKRTAGQVGLDGLVQTRHSILRRLVWFGLVHHDLHLPQQLQDMIEPYAADDVLEHILVATTSVELHWNANSPP